MPKVPKKEAEKDLHRYKAIYALNNQEGGKELIKLLVSDIATSIDTIAGNYKELSHTEFIAQGARIAERLALYKLLKSSKHNMEIVEDVLKTEYEDTD